ncbi:MAG: response regulator [Cenarchaeum sp. SB0669_bin_11]|nr:hypothetical protein [Acidimicrobiaceae bacterium]MYL10594.1 response regulator [Cenarchaeum sp. SB0669_bin_11]
MTQFFRVIRDQCDSMRELIGGLLDVARIETGSLLVVPEPCDLYLLVDGDPEALRYVRNALLETGYAPVVTGDPKAVPRPMDTEKPDLVLLDLMLPEQPLRLTPTEYSLLHELAVNAVQVRRCPRRAHTAIPTR